jgi:hypothetical protein
MRNIILILLVFGLIYQSFSEDKNQNIDKDKIRIFVSKVEFGNQAEEISMSKVEAALLFASRLTGKYEIIPFALSDSIVNELSKIKKEATAQKVATSLGAERIWTMRIDRMNNMLRANISQVEIKNPKKKKNGIGYCLVNYFEDKTNKRFYDPSLLKAIQRAFAVVVGDSLLFSNESDKLKVIPAKTLVIGGVDFVEDESLPLWELYDKKVVTSYDATEAMFEVVKDYPDFCAYDMASRDSIYAMFNYHIVENYRPPTTFEFDALNKLEVEYYLTGWIQRNKEGANLEILLFKLNGKGKKMTLVKSDSAILPKDDAKEFRELVRKLAISVLKQDKK